VEVLLRLGENPAPIPVPACHAPASQDSGASVGSLSFQFCQFLEAEIGFHSFRMSLQL
jgi:hypothetical protein